MTDYYTCEVCGLDFEYQKDKKRHQEEAHNGKLTNYDKSGELKKLEGMTRALRRNDYDKNNTISDRTNQHDLRNRKVRRKSLKDFTN